MWVGQVPRGKFVSVAHPGGIKTVYLGLENIRVRRKDLIRKGQVIGSLSGLLDDSSDQPHLHFGTYLNGIPLDPEVILDSKEFESFVRLCPNRSDNEIGGIGARNEYLYQGKTRKFRYPNNKKEPEGSNSRRKIGNVITKTAGFIVKKAKGAVWGILRYVCSSWSKTVLPFLKSAWRLICKAARFAWSNKWVKALTAGILAAVVVVLGVALSVVTFGVAIAAGITAAVAGVVASLGGAVFFAFCQKGGFNFSRCFWFCLSAGCVASCFFGSLASLGGAFSTGIVRLGAFGIIKSSFFSGSFSVIFDVSWQYLTTGHITLRAILIAFSSGAITGFLGKTLLHGIRSTDRLLRFADCAAHSIGFWERIKSVAVAGIGYVKNLTSAGGQIIISRGAKIGYMFFSGSLSAGLHISICAITRTPVRVSNLLAAFCTGLTIGVISLSFGGQGIGGLLDRVKLFGNVSGRWLKRLVAKVSMKMLGKGVGSGYRYVFKNVFGNKTIFGSIEQEAEH